MRESEKWDAPPGPMTISPLIRERVPEGRLLFPQRFVPPLKPIVQDYRSAETRLSAGGGQVA